MPKEAKLGYFCPVTKRLRTCPSVFSYDVFLLWVHTPRKTKSGKISLDEHEIHLNLEQALKLRHALDIAIDLEAKRIVNEY